MPGGLIQSVLCEECFVNYDRLDECFYYTMKNILNRLEISIEVYNPTDASKSLLLKQKDKDKMNNWKNQLNDNLTKLDIITKSICTKKQAFNSWHDFFNHPFWEYDETEEVSNRYANVVKKFVISDEEFIEKKYNINISYYATIECEVSANGFRPQSIVNILKSNKWLPRNRELLFSCKTNAPTPYDVSMENKKCWSGS